MFSCFCGCSGDGGTRDSKSPNLAWELIRGLAGTWNQTDQGFCITLPPSLELELRIFVILVNLSFIFNFTKTAVKVLGYQGKAWQHQEGK